MKPLILSVPSAGSPRRSYLKKPEDMLIAAEAGAAVETVAAAAEAARKSCSLVVILAAVPAGRAPAPELEALWDKADALIPVAEGRLDRAVQGAAELLRSLGTGYIGLDASDVRLVLQPHGPVYLGFAEASGKAGYAAAAAAAVRSDLTCCDLEGARRVLLSITAAPDLRLEDLQEITGMIRDAAHPDADIIFGLGFEESMPAAALRMVILASGYDPERA